MAYLMVVDDDEDFTSAAALVLRDEGHEVNVQLDPGGVIPSMMQRQPDLLLLDVMFPEDSSAGFKLARRIHLSEPPLRDVPILMLTALSLSFPFGISAKDIDEDWLPVADFLEKPVDLDMLRRRVGALLQSRRRAGPEH